VWPSIGFFTRFRPASAPERSFLSQDDCVQNPGSSLSLGRIGIRRSANFQFRSGHIHFPRQTHFICIPLRSRVFREKVTEFNALLPPTLNPTIICPTGSLHFTLGVLSLKTQEDIDKAVTFLQSCPEVYSAVQEQKITIALRGIGNMHKDVKRTSVIYAVPEEGDG
jgi:hypothetical protein